MEPIDAKKLLKIYKDGFSYKSYINKRDYLKIISMLIVCIIDLAVILRFFNTNKFFFIIGVLIYLLILIGVACISKTIYNKIRVSNNMNKTLDINEAVKIVRIKKFLNYIEKDCKITKANQKEKLIDILKEEANKNKVSELGEIAIVVALILPIWNKVIDLFDDFDEFIKSIPYILILALLILITVVALKRSLIDKIIFIKNYRNRKYNEMVHALNHDLIYNYYNSESSEKSNKRVRKRNH